MLITGEQMLTTMTATTGLRAELLDATVRLLRSRDVAGLATRDIASCSAGRLRSVGPAHSAGDQTILIDDRVLFAGDLLETRMFAIFPYFPPLDTDVNGSRWIGVLDELIASKPEIVVPGVQSQ